MSTSPSTGTTPVSPTDSPSPSSPASSPTSEPPTSEPTTAPPTSTTTTPTTTPDTSSPSTSEPTSSPPLSTTPSTTSDNGSTSSSSTPTINTSNTSAPTVTPSQSSASVSLGTPQTETSMSTLVATNANGDLFTSTIVSTLVVTPTVTSSSNSSSNSNAGAIAGGVVGGVAGLAIILALLFFFFRKRNHNDEFDGNFDPDRVPTGRPGELDLGAAEVTPYTYGESGGGAPEMAQSGVPSFLAAGTGGATTSSGPSAYNATSNTAPSQYSDGSQYGDYAAYAEYAGGNPSREAYGVPPRNSDFRHPSPGPSIAPTADTSATPPSVLAPGVLPSSKEREAMSQRRVVNDSGRVVQHQDGGRLESTAEEDVPREIPPSYDSIPRDRRQ
ncbi:hypothetical protein ABKN59_000895 [Abortiporus biennis]